MRFMSYVVIGSVLTFSTLEDTGQIEREGVLSLSFNKQLDFSVYLYFTFNLIQVYKSFLHYEFFATQATYGRALQMNIYVGNNVCTICNVRVVPLTYTEPVP